MRTETWFSTFTIWMQLWYDKSFLFPYAHLLTLNTVAAGLRVGEEAGASGGGCARVQGLQCLVPAQGKSTNRCSFFETLCPALSPSVCFGSCTWLLPGPEPYPFFKFVQSFFKQEISWDITRTVLLRQFWIKCRLFILKDCFLHLVFYLKITV